jgi:hypothetical protein
VRISVVFAKQRMATAAVKKIYWEQFNTKQIIFFNF